MFYNELLTKLIYLTKRNNISQKEIGDAINYDRRTMNKRALKNSEFTQDEIERIEEYFNINLSNVTVIDNIYANQNVLSETENSKDYILNITKSLSQKQLAACADLIKTYLKYI